jgi:fatty acid desaturase
VTIAAWRKALNRPTGEENQIIFWLLILACFFLFAYSLRRFHNRESKQRSKAIENEKVQFLATGLVALLAAGIPFWVTMINIELDFPWDRPTISFSVGVAMLISVGISFVFQNKFQTLVTASLIAFAIGSHYTNALVYRNEAKKMNDYFWQLAWRAPQLQAGTILVSEQIPLDRYSDSDLTPIVNWQYAPALKGNTYQ